MAGELQGRKVAFLVANEGVEQAALAEPWQAVERAGATPVLLAPEQAAVQAFHQLERAGTFEPSVTVAEAQPDDYVALVLPGGTASLDPLRDDADAVALTRRFVEDGKPVAAIALGASALVAADVVRGRTLTSGAGLEEQIREAGGAWVDEAVVVDAGLISSRGSDDLPAFCQRLVDELAAGDEAGQSPDRPTGTG